MHIHVTKINHNEKRYSSVRQERIQDRSMQTVTTAGMEYTPIQKACL